VAVQDLATRLSLSRGATVIDEHGDSALQTLTRNRGTLDLYDGAELHTIGALENERNVPHRRRGGAPHRW
jgi:hypothetical protein